MVNYRDFQPAATSRRRENIEWSIRYAFNERDTAAPRLLLIGDSICNGYHARVREMLAEHANITYWASSRCVTDPAYFRELDFLLDDGRYDLVSFNNGLHSLSTERSEWEAAYRAAAEFIRAKCPEAKLSLTLCTPLKDPAKDAVVRELNAFTRALAEELELPVIDLYTPLDALDKEEHMADVYHWKDAGRELQAEIICAHAAKQLHFSGGNVQLATETVPDGAMR